MANREAAPVVVGVDGSAESLAALDWAATYCERSGQELLVAVAWHVPTEHASAVAALREVNLETASGELVQSAVDEARVSHPGLDIAHIVRSGAPGRVLVELSADAPLLVVGTKRTLGTVSSYCAHYASCPVVIMRLKKSA